MLSDRVDRMRDPHGRRRPPFDVDRRRRLEHFLRELSDRRWHRRAEEQRLAFGSRRQVLQHTPDVGEEAHVEHAIGFVQDEILQTAEFCVRRAEMIEQPAGRGDDDVDAAAKRVFLRAHPNAAEHSGRRQRRVHSQIVEVFDYLRRQFPCGREHQRSRRPSGLADESVQNRKQERGGFSAAGHRARQQVLTGHRQRDRVSLNGRGAGKPEIFEPLQQARMQS